MRVFNIMLSRDLGGIQQAYIDFNEALVYENHEVINISSINAKVNTSLTPNNKLLNLVPWCFLSKAYLGRLIKKYQPDFIICHGNRAINFSCYAKNHNLKIIGITHNYSFKHLKKCDFIITLSNSLRQNLIDNNILESKLLKLSNMIRINTEYKPFTRYKTPVTIGSFGRFVEKKGFSYLIEAIN